LKLERDEGFFLGSMSLNYGVTIFAFLLPVLILYLTGQFSGVVAAIVAGLGAIGFPVAFYRSSRSWWLMTYYFFLRFQTTGCISVRLPTTKTTRGLFGISPNTTLRNRG